MEQQVKPYRRWGAVIAALTGLLVLGMVLTLALVRPWSTGGEVQVVTGSTPPPAPPAVLRAAGGDAPAATADGVREAIDELVRDSGLGDRVSASVVDVATGTTLYEWAPDTPAIPASTIKLVTAATVLATRGQAYRIPTTAVAGERPGEVVLVGGGDPTLAIDETGAYPGAARLDELAAQVRGALRDTPVTEVIVDATRFRGEVYGDWDDDIPHGGYVAPITALMTDGGRIDPAEVDPPADRWDDPDLAAGEAFAALLGLGADARVERGEAPRPREAAPGDEAAPGGEAAPGDEVAPGDELGRVASPPLQRLVEIMLTSSDNVVAEALARQVALARGEPASYQGAAAAMAAVLDQLGVPLAGSEFADGSGLSRANRITVTLLTSLLSGAAVVAADPAHPEAGLFAGLPVAGWSGTLAERYRSPQPEIEPGAGVVRAKTGTLRGVHAIAGLVETADGRLLAFAVLANRVPVDDSTARAALDRIAGALAGCGCP